MLRCVVLDDEPLAREVLNGYLNRLDGISSVRQFANARDALLYLENHEADILFLDIEMPGMNGLDFLKTLTNPPVTVFTTAYRNYAFEGFELGVIDFLLKPIAYPRFLQAIEKIQDFLSLKDQNTRIENEPSQPLPESIFVKSGVQRIKLNFDDVTHIQGLKDYAIIHTATGRIVIKGSIKAMHEIFPASRFIRVHKSFIAAIARISRIDRNRLMINGNPIPVGRNYKEAVEKALFDR
ncbi:response regulator transcription factor [Spirosoma taeanense]|uniref:Response regulator transcription factor n=1 Tax=Spirosoma taeanense TaxID=2735870 RepID=A0A6M5Y9G6_9BACT|nr:LytTR family DNA-binding domain-containing protein [Spirosoma taeanense]QJW89452.1 response regulator transcription factor [Spirosoma taeanense]